MKNALFWSVKRELWENRSVYIAPLLVAVLLLGASFVVAFNHLDQILAKAAAVDPAKARLAMARAFDGVAAALIVASVMVAWFYCLDSLYGERRDRSILFWKSLPVSDATSVAAKAIVPLLIVPAVAFAMILATQLLMVLASTAVLLAKGREAGTLWSGVFSPANVGSLLYALLALSLWLAPVYAYLMAISAAVQRSPFLWAVLPIVAAALVEKVVLGTTAVLAFVKYRLLGSFEASFVVPRAPLVAAGTKGEGQWLVPGDPVPDPAKFFGSPDLWVGLAVAVALLALAVWLRRRRDPI
jgi:ABC-2 type transport system permease protein